MSYQSILRDDAFAGKTILVTGGGSGLGRCIAHELSKLGARLLLIGRNEEKLQRVQQELQEDGGTAFYDVADIRDEETMTALVASFICQHGPIHGLVNNAGGQFPTELEKMSAKGFMAVVETNLLGGFIVAREVYKQSMAKFGGSIVNITAATDGGLPRMAHSAAARAGMENLTKSAALEWVRKGVRVNAVAPGMIASSGLDTYKDPVMIANFTRMGKKIPLARPGTEAEVSCAVCFLLSEAAAYITGSILRVDGGMSLSTSSALHDLIIAEQHNDAFDGFHRSNKPKVLED